MALIGINPVQGDTRPRPPSTLEKIAMGVDIASKVLGTGLTAYDTLGPKRTLQNAETEKSQSETLKNMTEAGYQMAPSQLLSQHEDAATSAGYVPADADKLHIHPNDPKTIKIGDRTFIQGPDLKTRTAQDNLTTDYLKANNMVFTSEGDPEKSGVAYLGGRPYATKEMPVSKEKQAALQGTAEGQFLGSDTVKRYNVIQSAALTASNIMQKNKVEPSDDQALIMATIRTMNPDASIRFNGDTVEGLSGQLDTTANELWKKTMNAYHNHQQILSPEERAQILGTIRTMHDSERQNYQDAYNGYLQKVQSVGVNPSVKPLRSVQFPNVATGGGAPTKDYRQDYIQKHLGGQ